MTFTLLMTRHRRMHSFKKEYEADFDQLQEENAKRIKVLSTAEPPSYESHQYAAQDKTLFLVPTTTAVEVGPDSAASSPGVERIEFLPMIEDRLLAGEMPAVTAATAAVEEAQESQVVTASAEAQQPMPQTSSTEELTRHQGEVEYIDYDDMLDEIYYGNGSSPLPHQVPAPAPAPAPQAEQNTDRPDSDYIEIEAFTVPAVQPQPLTEFYAVPMATPALSRRSLTLQSPKGKAKPSRLIIRSSQEILCWTGPF